MDSTHASPFSPSGLEAFSPDLARSAGSGHWACPLISTSPTKPASSLEIDALRNRVHRLRRSVRFSSEALKGQGGRVVMQTLTYRPGVDWKPYHISQYTDAVTKHFLRRGLPFRRVWVAELQGRGAVHYHVLVWLPRGAWLPKADKAGWWPHGSTNNSTSKKPVRDATGYVCKYASKLHQKGGGYPKGMRMHGAGGLDKTQRRERTWHMAPAWLRDQTCADHIVSRRVGGGWISKLTGEYFESPFFIDLILFRAGVGPIIYVSRYENYEVANVSH